MKRITGLLLIGLLLVATACAAGREIRHPAGCDERLAVPEKQAACRACVTRPRPHVYLPDEPEGERCVPR